MRGGLHTSTIGLIAAAIAAGTGPAICHGRLDGRHELLGHRHQPELDSEPARRCRRCRHQRRRRPDEHPPTLRGDVVGVAAVPEPETYVLMLAGLLALGRIAQRRRHRREVSRMTA